MFSGRIRCGECGGIYGRKTWHSTDKYCKSVWQCNEKYKRGKDRCRTRHVSVEEIKTGFMEELNRILKNKKKVISDALILQEMAAKPIGLVKKLEKLTDDKNLLTKDGLKNKILLDIQLTIAIKRRLTLMYEFQQEREELLLRAFRELSSLGQKKVIEYAQYIKEKYKEETPEK